MDAYVYWILFVVLLGLILKCTGNKGPSENWKAQFSQREKETGKFSGAPNTDPSSPLYIGRLKSHDK